MKQIRKRLTYANVMSSLAVFLVLGGGAAVAAKTVLPKNSVGAQQIKRNAVTAAKIKTNAVTAAKIKRNAVTTAKLRNNAVTGAKVAEKTLGTVPRAAAANTARSAETAASAASADQLRGQTTFAVRLGFGQSRQIAAHGAVSLVANCRQDAEEEEDVAEILFATAVNGAVADGNSSYNGSEPDELLNVDTPPAARALVRQYAQFGETYVRNDTNEGFVLGPDGKGLVVNSEGIILGLNYGAPGCYIAGVANAVG